MTIDLRFFAMFDVAKRNSCRPGWLTAELDAVLGSAAQYP
jgi:hypothetical protein